MHDTRVDEAIVLLLDHSEPQVLFCSAVYCLLLLFTTADEAIVLLLDHSEPQVLATILYICVLMRLYACPHTTYVSAYYYICVLILLHAAGPLGAAGGGGCCGRGRQFGGRQGLHEVEKKKSLELKLVVRLT
jgi:hypothetical protein